mmetsp:Transcript_18843/g.32199  ORF Transcript_18843/g.32199 Transcript_18843/m.32199 type:complete len:85 (-) Transcript_18843:973-1227(-)
MTQEVEFFERNNVEAMPSDIGQYFNTISLGIGESFAQLIQSGGVFVGGFTIALYKGTAFTIICLAYIPCIILFLVLLGKSSRAA